VKIETNLALYGLYLDLKNLPMNEALLRLAEDQEDAVALITVFQENREAITAEVTRWLGTDAKYDEASKDVLLKIGENARCFNPQVHDARKWVSECAYHECARLRLEIERAASAYN
jgi:hypothetical protein